jgi:rod shape determining protein RodA
MLRRLNVDWPLVGIASALTAFGLAMLYSAGQTETPTVASGAFRAQSAWLLVALGAAYAASRASIRLVEWMTVPLYVIAVGLLIVLLIPGMGTGAGTSRWLTLGGIRLGQPSEFAKLAVVLMLARTLSHKREPAKSMLELWKPMLIVAVPLALIVRQPDLGTGVALMGIFFPMLFWSGVRWQLLLLVASPVISLVLGFDARIWGAWFLFLLALLVWYKPYQGEGVFVVVANVMMGVVGPTLWERLAPYQQARLRTFLDPTVDPRRTGYHVIQSQVAIGSGGWFGQGYMEGPQKRLAFLPAQHTDFIFSVVGEELGFIGVTLALTMFLLLFLRVVRIAERANEAFSGLVAFGLLGSWFVHVAENVGMTLNLTPVTGIPLPFFSYGGSFLVMSWIAVGILSRISSEGRGRSGQYRL